MLWLKEYSPGWLKSDIFAGITLAAYGIPVSMAYASLAGLPVQCGIYGYFIGGIFYALFGTGRQLAIGPTSAISLLIGTSLATMAKGDVQHWLDIASLTALVTGVFSLTAYLLRLSSIINFISESVLLGFKAGAAMIIAATQLPKLFGIPGGGNGFFERIGILFQQLPADKLTGTAFRTGGHWHFSGRKQIFSRTAISHSFGCNINHPDVCDITSCSRLFLNRQHTTGTSCLAFSISKSEISAGSNSPGFCQLFAGIYRKCFCCKNPGITREDMKLTRGRNCWLLHLPMQPLLSHKAIRLPEVLSQSAVNSKAGARTSLSLIFASVTIGLCLIFLTGPMKYLPDVMLAAILLVAIGGLIDIKGMMHLWKVSRIEFTVAMIALAGVIIFGILRGVALAAVSSIVLLLRAVSVPHVAFLGRIPGTTRYTDISRHPDNETIPGLLIVRVESSLFYFNAENVRKAIWNG